MSRSKAVLLAEGDTHKLPPDMKKVLRGDAELAEKWNGLTLIARDEWICWVSIVKKAETRASHLKRLEEDLLAGKRRPCCWPGCPHRRPKAAKWFAEPEKRRTARPRARIDAPSSRD